MKTFITIASLLAASSSFADLDYQMTQTLGDWKAYSFIARFVKQSENSVKMYRCNREIYFNSPNKQCTYSGDPAIMTYRSDLDAFYDTGIPGRFCPDSLQVSADSSSVSAIVTTDPYFVGGNICSSGETVEIQKL